MFSLFHFLFELVKIAALSAIYSALILLMKSIFFKTADAQVMNKRNFWLVFKITYSLLFFFSFTYYGNHGLGDEYAIPIGRGQTINQVDEFAYFSPNSSGSQIQIDRFIVKGDFLCANSEKQYFVYNLNYNKVTQFNSETSYETYAANNQLPPLNTFKKYNDCYNDYWNGWRFWLLP